MTRKRRDPLFNSVALQPDPQRRIAARNTTHIVNPAGHAMTWWQSRVGILLITRPILLHL